MPYTIKVYTKQERDTFHRFGIWINRRGDEIPVNKMGPDRLEKLVKMLATWAMDEPDPIFWLKNHPIFPHVLARINYFGLDTYHASMFRLANMTYHKTIYNF